MSLVATIDLQNIQMIQEEVQAYETFEERSKIFSKNSSKYTQFIF
jgi:hypothetical protein